MDGNSERITLGYDDFGTIHPVYVPAIDQHTSVYVTNDDEELVVLDTQGPQPKSISEVKYSTWVTADQFADYER